MSLLVSASVWGDLTPLEGPRVGKDRPELAKHVCRKVIEVHFVKAERIAMVCQSVTKRIHCCSNSQNQSWTTGFLLIVTATLAHVGEGTPTKNSLSQCQPFKFAKTVLSATLLEFGLASCIVGADFGVLTRFWNTNGHHEF